jgi:hypothetical protein
MAPFGVGQARIARQNCLARLRPGAFSPIEPAISGPGMLAMKNLISAGDAGEIAPTPPDTADLACVVHPPGRTDLPVRGQLAEQFARSIRHHESARASDENLLV